MPISNVVLSTRNIDDLISDIANEVVRQINDNTNPQQQTTSKEDETIYGLQGLADFLGVGLTTAWQIKNSGQIPYYQAGRKKIYFKASEILAATAKKKEVRNG